MREEIINRVADECLQYIRENSWAGACFAISAVNSVLLKEFDIDAHPCLGVFSAEVAESDGKQSNLAFDHAWVMHESMIIDVAITNGLNVNFGSGLLPADGIRGKTCSAFKYGINMDMDEDTLRDVANFSIFMRNSPHFDPSLNYWDLATILAKRVGLIRSKNELERRYKNLTWKIVRGD